MPAAIPLIAGAFLAAGSIATAVGLGTALVVAGLTITWAAALTITGVALMAVSFLARKVPKPDSAGQQLQQKLDPQAPIPIIYGRTATGGFITSRNTFGKKNANYGIVTVLSVGAILGIESYQAGDYPVGFNRNPAVQTATVATVGSYSGNTKLYKGKLHQRWVNGEIPASLTPATASGYPVTGGRMSAVAYAVTVYEYNTDAFPQGLPASMWVVRGQKVYDPRKDSTYPGGSGSHRRDVNATWEYSENPFLCGLNWTLGRHENGKRLFGIGAKWDEVDVASFVAGANVADANGWKVGGQVVSTDDKYAVLASILAAGSGSPIARGAQIACSVNAPKTATLTLSRDDIIGEVEIQSSTSLRDRQNTIVPRYREESQQWEIVSGERVSAPLYVTEDRGQTRTVEIEMPLVQQAAQAHQLAAYELVNSREFLTFTVKAKLRMLAARVGDAITVNVSEISANTKKCVVVGREFNPADATVTLSLKSETDAKHAFALGQSQVAPPSSKLDGYDPSNPDAPEETAWSITETKISNGTNTIPAIVVSGAVDDPFAVSVIAEYRPLGSSVWLAWGEHPRDTKRIEITAVTDQTAYEIALSYRSTRGVVGERLIMTATAGALIVSYGNVNGTPTKIRDVNESEGIKFEGIEAGADVTGNHTSNDTKNVGGKPAQEIVNQVVKIGAIEGDIASLKTTYGDTAAAKAEREAAQAAAAAAEASKQSASGSAGSASTYASNAQGQAQIANDKAAAAAASATQSSGFRDQASSFATNASNSATAASQDAARASSSVILAAQVSSGSVNNNAAFNVPGYAGGIPSGWNYWLASEQLQKSDQPGRNGTIPVKMIRNGNQEIGVSQTLNNISAGWYVIEAEVQKLSGNWQGSGVHCNFNNGTQINLGFATYADTEGRFEAGAGYDRRNWSVLVFNPLQANASFYAMGGWSGLGFDGSSNDTHWHKCLIRPATDGEIKGHKAYTADPSSPIAASVKTVSDAFASLNGSFAQYKVDVGSTIGTASSNASLALSSATTALGRTGAYFQVQAVSTSGMASITVGADGATAGTEIVGNVTFRGNLNVGPDSGQRMKITSNSIIIYDANNMPRVKLGLF